MTVLTVRRAGPGVTVQDRGRSGHLGQGLSRGGAADRLALSEGAALLGQSDALAALELAGTGGAFAVDAPARIALTGAPMRAAVDGARLAWHASHPLLPGQVLEIGALEAGCYGYLHLGGGIDGPMQLGARSAHLTAGLGAAVADGACLPLGDDPQPDRTGLKLAPEPRFSGGTVRVVPSLQTGLFPEAQRARFEATLFHRDTRGNRMGVRVVPDDGAGFESVAGLSVLSEVIVSGDIQVTGDGTPFVLLCESQTTGGYPRIATVLPADLPIVAQAPAGAGLRFRFVSIEEGVGIEAAARRARERLPQQVRRRVRRPEEIGDLLAYQLIGGVTAGRELEQGEDD